MKKTFGSARLSTIIEHPGFPPVFFSVLACLFLVHNDHISLWEQDEAAYAGFARRMLESGDWLIPDYFWAMIHRKTPLHFWNIAVSYLFFGENNFALRFSSALSIWLMYWCIYRMGRTILGEYEIRLSLLVLSSSLLVNSLAKIAVTDGTLLFFTSLAILALLRHISGQASAFNTAVFWMAVSAGTLVKGPPVLISTGFLSVLLFLFHPDRKKLIHLHPWFFLPLALLPLFFWGRAAWERDQGAFISWLLDWYIFRRFTGSLFGQTAPPGAYFLLISVAFLPFLFIMPRMWRRVVNAVFVQKDRIYSLLLLWFVAAWLPFEFSPSKLPAYTAAAHVPFAMMIARVLNELRQQKILAGWLFRLQILIQILIIAAIPAAVFFLDLPLLFKVSSLAAASLLSLLAVKLLLGKEVNLTGLMALNGGFMVFVWLIVYGQIDPVKNSPELVGNYLKGRYRQAVIANSGGHPPGLFVYTERAVGKVILMTNSDTLRQLATSMNQTAFVFSERQWEEIGPAAGLRLDTVIRGRFTDRKGMASYFIASRRRY